jgi:hypothetical protein
MFESLKSAVRPGLFLSLAAAVTVLCQGCVSRASGPSLYVGNATEQSLADVRLVSGEETYTFASIAAFTVSTPAARREALAEKVLLAWTAEDGVKGCTEVRLSDELRNFGGNMQFEVNGGGIVKVFTAPAAERGSSMLPWSMPASWEGAPTIPGMNM